MIPKHDEIQLPALQALEDGTPRRPRELEEPLARHFQLSEEERTRMYESGSGPICADRIGWAMSYLSLTGLAERPKRGLYRISDTGRRILRSPEELPAYVKKKTAERDRQKKRDQAKTAYEEVLGEPVDELTPRDQLEASFEKLRASVYDDILDTILSKSPTDFEHLVVQLLNRMGYGDQIRDACEVTNASNDGGIDGIIKEDVLGLGRIHIQAKRYARNRSIGREEIQKFVGALAVAQSQKGVFITTSKYTVGAQDYAASLNGTPTLVLVDGQGLAEYIYEFDLGMQVEKTLEIKKLDSDFWDSRQDDPT